jgi:Ca-activated chloride channel homolog
MYCKKLKSIIIASALIGHMLLANSTALANQLTLNVSTGSSSVLADKKQTIPLRISLTGFQINSERNRAPVNVGIVIDRSGSMSGEKIERAKEAAITAVEMLKPDDIISIITYDDSVNVLVPSTKLSDRSSIIQSIRNLQPGGSTALFAGVSKGAGEVRKFIDKEKVNRVILISDGIANVGPSSPGELGNLGSSLIKEGIAVSTIGLGTGYNEDLMTKLADKSDGNHAFVERSSELADIFRKEFRDLLSVVAQDVDITINLGEGFRPIRCIGRDVDINGQTVRAKLNQIYSQQEKYLILEIEAPATEAGSSKDVAKVDVAYENMSSKVKDRVTSTVGVSFTKSNDEVLRTTNKTTLEGYYGQIANSARDEAVKLRDQGKQKEAQQALEGSSMTLKEQGQKYNLPSLMKKAEEYEQEQNDLVSGDWNTNRKSIREKQYKYKNQQSW